MTTLFKPLPFKPLNRNNSRHYNKLSIVMPVRAIVLPVGGYKPC